LNLKFLSKVNDAPSVPIADMTPEQHAQWDTFNRKSYTFYDLMHQLGNQFYLTHKVDKRGRIYASAYYINTQGTSFKKAMLDLATTEVVQGVPV
jgi:DNA-directed RNA polymerase